MTPLDKLIRQFEKFPGIGGRQAKRFAYHLLREPAEDLEELARLISSIKSNVVECHSCYRYYSNGHGGNLCNICGDASRDNSKLTVVGNDSDMLAIERTGLYSGHYFILGGYAPLLESKDTSKLRGGELKHIIDEKLKEGLNEIILAFAVNPDGENTGRYIQMLLKEPIETNDIKITTLGRGLSTGSELEYADTETIKNALINRG